MSPQPGWFPDPWELAALRWWDGTQWTHHVEAPVPPPAPEVPVAPAAPPVAAAAPPVPGGLVARGLVLGGTAVMAAGSVLPWARASSVFFGTVDIAGTEGDGVLTLLCAGVIAVMGLVAFTGSGGRGFLGGALGAGLVALVVAVIDTVDVTRLVGSTEDLALGGVDVRVGVGLWLVLVSSAAVVVGSALALRPRTPA